MGNLRQKYTDEEWGTLQTESLLNKHKRNKKSGFFDLPNNNVCNHGEHYPPTHLHIPQGKGYRHVCPSCGNVIEVIPLQIRF